jgi:hypothetical protein
VALVVPKARHGFMAARLQSIPSSSFERARLQSCR